MNEKPKNQFVSDLFRTQDHYAKPPFNTQVDGDVYACTVPGIGIEPGFVITDNDGKAYRRSQAIVSGDPMALMIQLQEPEPAPKPAPPSREAHESEPAPAHTKHNKSKW